MFLNGTTFLPLKQLSAAKMDSHLMNYNDTIGYYKASQATSSILWAFA